MGERTFNFMNERISSQNYADGRHIVKTTPEGVNILANIVDGKVTSYEAEDLVGKQCSLFIVKEKTPVSAGEVTTFSSVSDTCWICVDSGFGSPICYEDWCDVVADLIAVKTA